MTPPRQAIVIGGGIAGLACAYRLQEMGISVSLFEASERVGGLIRSEAIGGFLFEAGPQSLLASPRLRELIAPLNLQEELLHAPARAPRYVLLRGRLQKVPLSPPALLTTSLLGAATKFRLLVEPLRRSSPPEEDEPLADFVRRKFGEELLDRLVGPFASGIYAGDPEKLSLRSAFPALYEWESRYGSVVRGALKSRPSKKEGDSSSLCSFRGGVATLATALARKIGRAVRLQAPVERLEANGSASPEQAWRVGLRSGLREVASTVVIATPAYEAARLLEPLSAGAATALASISYAPVAVVAGGYRRSQVSHPLNGFGYLAPRSEGIRTLGTVWNSSLFASRAPEGMVTLTSFAGGATDRGILELEPDAIARQVEREVGRVLGINYAPVERFVERHRHGLPQYNIGHREKIAALRDELQNLRGIFLAGNYLDGPSVGSCIENAFRIAERVREFLERTGAT